MTRRRVLGGIAASMALPVPADAQARPLVFGALFPFSGDLSLLGDESFRGLQLAVEDCNVSGGIAGRRVELVKGDSVDPAHAISEVRRLIDEAHVEAVFGTFASPMCVAASQVTELAGIAYFELCAISDEITARGFLNLFRICPRAIDFARVSVAAIESELAPRWARPAGELRIAILHEDGLYGASLAQAQQAQCRQRDLQVVDTVPYAAATVDFAPQVQRLRASAADIVLHNGYQNDIVLFYRAMSDARWRPGMVIGGGSGYSLADTARAAGPNFEGTMNVDFTPDGVNEAMAPGLGAIADAYRRKFGMAPRSGHSMASAVGGALFLAAVRQAGSATAARVRAAVMATDIACGGTATGWGVRFDTTGQNTRASALLLQWRGGRQVTVGPASAAVASVVPRLGA